MKEETSKQAEINTKKKWRKCEGRNEDLNSTERIQGKGEGSGK
jgi:hypothetical protein